MVTRYIHVYRAASAPSCGYTKILSVHYDSDVMRAALPNHLFHLERQDIEKASFRSIDDLLCYSPACMEVLRSLDSFLNCLLPIQITLWTLPKGIISGFDILPSVLTISSRLCSSIMFAAQTPYFATDASRFDDEVSFVFGRATTFQTRLNRGVLAVAQMGLILWNTSASISTARHGFGLTKIPVSLFRSKNKVSPPLCITRESIPIRNRWASNESDKFEKKHREQDS